MTYLDNIRKDGKYANPFFCLAGIEVVTMEEGRAILKMAVRSDMHNGVGWLQGGMLVALADEAMALALYPMLEMTEGIATISESTSFIKGIRDGVILAEGRVIRKGRRVAFCEGEVRVDDTDKTVLSRTTASFALMACK
ncbi:PaaI family thioesterase [Methanoregula sp.]|uniref:PaaI family thioesterase n=1 Tax=Methanoregula sp. TaxID=2052170 RepID=UPI003BB09F00